MDTCTVHGIDGMPSHQAVGVGAVCSVFGCDVHVTWDIKLMSHT